MPEAQEGGGHAADDGAGFGLRVAIVEHVAHHRLAGSDERQRPRGRDAEVVHGLAAQKFAKRGAKDCAAVASARVRSRSGAFELDFVALPGGVHRFAEEDGAPVAELSGPRAELVAAVVRGVGLHARQQAVSG